MDLTSIVGLFLGAAFILTAQAMEGGSVTDLMQLTAAMIVIGGASGAVILSFPASDLQNAFKYTKFVFLNLGADHKKVIAEIIDFATKARKEGVITLEKEAKKASDPLMKLGLEAVSDGADPTLVRDLMETQLGQMEEQMNRASKVWEGAGAYLPTFGIIGAVLGLIQVMKNLSDPASLGAGIAVAFVATVYGLAAANMVCIPLSTKIKLKCKEDMLAKEIIIEGILSIQAGESPALIERKLNAFLLESAEGGANGQSREATA